MTTPAVRGSRGGPIAMVVVGALLLLLGIGPLVGGIAVAVVAAQQAERGAIESPSLGQSTEGYAIIVSELRMRSMLRQVPDEVADLQLSVRSGGDGDELFIGVGPRDDVADYLDDVAHAELVANRMQGGMGFRDLPGSRAPGEPAAEDFWVVSDSGSRDVQVELPLRTGDWVIVVMNDDASSGVDVAATVGARSDLLVPLAVALLLIGGAMLIGGLALVVAGAIGFGGGGAARQPGSERQAQPGTSSA